MIPKFPVAFEPIEYRALLFMLNEVGMRVQGAGPKTDTLRLLIPAVAEENDHTRVELSLEEICALLAVARIADGINLLDQCSVRGENSTQHKYDRMNASKAVIQVLDKAYAEITKSEI